MQRCKLCQWPLDDEHLFNVNCAVANAENDQLMAEVAEAQAQPMDPLELERLVSQGMEIVHDVIALKDFERRLREQP